MRESTTYSPTVKSINPNFWDCVDHGALGQLWVTTRCGDLTSDIAGTDAERQFDGMCRLLATRRGLPLHPISLAYQN